MRIMTCMQSEVKLHTHVVCEPGPSCANENFEVFPVGKMVDKVRKGCSRDQENLLLLQAPAYSMSPN